MHSTVSGSLLERERELDALANLVDLATHQAGAAVLIEGDAGIGKTALLHSARECASRAGMLVLLAYGSELESEFAWGLVRQLFDGPVARAAPAEREALLDGAAALATPALGITATPAAGDPSYATLHGLYWLTVNLAQRQPVMLAVDDAHLGDPPSLRFVAHLRPRIAELPILLLLTRRPSISEAAPGAALMAQIGAEPILRALRPAPLSRTATAELVSTELSAEASNGFCAACHDVSGGNPFLLRALITDLIDEQRPATDASIEHLRGMTPAAVSASVLLRLARLPPGALSLARAVAILGERTELRTARHLAQLDADQAADAAGALIHGGIFADSELLSFVHPLVRSGVYTDLPNPVRGRWHRVAAGVLADDGAPIERIASQLVESTPGGDPWTVERLREAAADARARVAPEVATDYLRRALTEPPDKQDYGDVLFELGQAELVREPARAVPHLSEALQVLREPRRRAGVALALGDALTSMGRLADAIPVLTKGVALLESEGPSELLALLEAARLGAARWEPTAQALRHELVDTIQARAALGERLDPRLHCQLAIEAAAAGTDRDAAVRQARAALNADARPADAATSALPEAMLVLVFADLADEARQAIQEWLDLARARALPLAVMLGATAGTISCLYRGAVSDAVANGWDAVNPGVDIRLAPISIAFLIEALSERGELDAARSELAKRGLDGELPNAWASAPLLLARGRLYAAGGDHVAAIDDLTATGERAETWAVRNPAMHPWRSSAAISLTRLGERERAIALANEELALARRWGTPRAIGVALRAAGIAHNELEFLRESVDVLESSTAPLEHARALTDLGSALRRAGHRAAAREQLRYGLDLAHRLGGIAVAERAREELTIAGARPRRDALRGRDALTSSELRIARLAASGRTNREIAEALFVTLRTVEAHLTSSYGKLEINSRQELSSALESTHSESASRRSSTT